MSRVETAVFKGVTFRRYPDSERRSDREYFTPGASDKQRGIQRLHQEVWKGAHGPIPPGHHVHHVDEDTSNNALVNLECLPGGQHLSDHMTGREMTPERREGLARAVEKAKEWHASEEGRAWHSEHAKAAWENRSTSTCHCQQCGDTYETHYPDRSKYCGNNCRAAARRAAKKDFEERRCEVCGDTYECNRYFATRTCSRMCGAQLRKRA